MDSPFFFCGFVSVMQWSVGLSIIAEASAFPSHCPSEFCGHKGSKPRIEQASCRCSTLSYRYVKIPNELLKRRTDACAMHHKARRSWQAFKKCIPQTIRSSIRSVSKVLIVNNCLTIHNGAHLTTTTTIRRYNKHTKQSFDIQRASIRVKWHTCSNVSEVVGVCPCSYVSLQVTQERT
uniref:Secreted protein n=1 Tax=Ceratitis capitata TaxID=7213 RepID=W8BPW5_CERCA